MKVKVPYFVWRDGRPRWEPGPHLRARGFKGVDLKDASGKFLELGAAIERAKELNENRHRLAPSPYLNSKVPHTGRPTMGALFGALRNSPKFRGDDGKGQRLAARTRAGYLSHLRILEAWCGDIPVASLSPVAVEDYYDVLVESRGLAMANALMRTLHLSLNYAHRKLRWVNENVAAGLDMRQPEGRLAMWTPQEIASFVAAADWAGLPAVGDAVMVAALSGQRRGDILASSDLRLENGVYVFQQAKTGRRAYVPPTRPLEARLEIMRARKQKRWPNVAFTHLILRNDGTPYPVEGSDFGYDFRAVRAVASGLAFSIEDFFDAYGGMPARLRNAPFAPQPRLLDLNFQDLRDTAVTMLLDAGCDLARVATISGHSLKSVQTIVDRHYFVRNAEMAKSAGRMLDALFAAKQI